MALKRSMATMPPGQLLELGVSHHRAGRLDEAEAPYRVLLTRYPGDVNACHLIGVIAFGRDDKAGALDWFRRARVNKPDHTEAAIFSGLSQMDLNRLDDACCSFCEAVALRPGEARIYNDLGALHLRRGDAETAMIAFALATALKPDSGL
ncbi:MAG: tetratricopeptide repeat protein [Alphaproteobacteria bacterium]|nr:tetratricopeptide repeat protein [Alphaproteobacteria bacterium]